MNLPTWALPRRTHDPHSSGWMRKHRREWRRSSTLLRTGNVHGNGTVTIDQLGLRRRRNPKHMRAI